MSLEADMTRRGRKKESMIMEKRKELRSEVEMSEGCEMTPFDKKAVEGR